MRWLQKQTNPLAAEKLAKALGLHPVVAAILAGRGFGEPDAAERFLESRLTDLPDPLSMKGMTKAVERIVRALHQGEPITVYGDYDVDGVTSTCLLVDFLTAVGARVDFYIPHRLIEGYGLNPDAVDTLARQGTKLIVTVDCGVTAVEEIDRATRAGVDVVVVDHHKAPPELPRATAMLNPHQPGCDFPSKELSAVGVAFFLLMALRKRLRDSGWFNAVRPEPNLRNLLDFVALGTVADVVPLVGANRILVTHGLRVLASTRRVGLQELKRVSLVGEQMTAGEIAFRMGPRINAAGRLDNAATAVELLLATDRTQAEALAGALDRANDERRQIESEITLSAISQAQPFTERMRSLVLHGDGWHPGVVGIVASRVVERFHRPTIIIGVDGDTARGSCRSIEKFDMFLGLGRCQEHLVRFGGHHHAAGLQIAPARIGAFREAFEQEAMRQLTPADLEPSIRYDLELPAAEATLDLAQALQVLAPFGAGHPEPVFTTTVRNVESRILPAKSGIGDHLKFRLGPADAIAFGMANEQGTLREKAKLAFQLQVNAWNGRLSASARVKTVEAAR